ncbi:hypothetical protein OHU45_31985 [Streptomyces tubercidicus]|uniref:hypothetical protein n=1 Tax=Streptomyces tubercidicus TaxID=47759 RepID=UPI002E10C735|nr:hypothetical protein OG761_31990 [Streptomyces tubercidicus]WSX19302.1 hypothetical protein OG690_05385 [Streptomyces tubercidicus]
MHTIRFRTAAAVTAAVLAGLSLTACESDEVASGGRSAASPDAGATSRPDGKAGGAGKAGETGKADSTGKADGEGGADSGGRTAQHLTVHFAPRSGSGSTGTPAKLTLPAGTHTDDDAAVTYWQSSASDALTY